MRGVNNMKKTITLTFLCIILLFSGCANNMTNKYNDKLLSDTEYVKSHILGVWSSSDGEIVEFYSNGIVVNYTPVKEQDIANIMDDVMSDGGSYSVESELKSIGYSGYTIPEPDSYTDEELQSYTNYAQNSQNIGITLKYNFWGVIEDKYISHEFQNEDTLIIGGKTTLTRMKNDEPTIDDNISGLYINEEDNNLGIRIIKPKSGGQSYFDWVDINKNLELYGECEIDKEKITLKNIDSDDFVFRRNEKNLTEIGSDTLPGSNMTYKKISNLGYMNSLKGTN